PHAIAAESFEPPPAVDSPPFADTMEEHGEVHTTADAYAPAHDGEPVFEGGGAVGEPFAEEPPPVAGESYLSAVRRSARAAAAQADVETGSRAGGFSWGAASGAEAAAADEDKPRINKTYLWIGIIALLAVVAIIAGALLSRNLGSGTPPATASAGPLFAKD